MAANGRFVEDITIPDDTAIMAGTAFTKTWLVENNGNADWGIGYQFVYTHGVNMAPLSMISLPACAPGEQTQISLTMTAPNTSGTVFSDWRFRDNQGNLFGEIIYLRILVKPMVHTAGINRSYFVADVTIPDDTRFEPGKTLIKTWRVRNTGTLPWNDRYSLSFVGGTMGQTRPPLPLPPVAPGGEVNLSIEFKAPQQPGTYYSDWQMKDDKGKVFGAKFWMRIIVPAPVVTTPVIPPPPPINIQAPAPHYSQRDARWANTPLGNIATAPSIGRWGCMMTSFAMLASTMGHPVTPAELNNLMVQRGGYMNGYLTRWNALQVVFGDLFFDGKVDQSQAMLDRIDACLKTGRPVPVLVDLSPATTYSDNDQHWVLVVGRNGEDYWMNDPIEYTAGPTLLVKRYGKSGGRLLDAVRSAIFYRK